MFTIEIANLEHGLHLLEFTPDVKSLDLDVEAFKDVEVDARLDVSERRILVSLDVRAAALLECDRTLKPFEQKIEGFYDLLFAQPDFVAADDHAFDEIRPMDLHEQEVDVTDAVRDTILLAVPPRHVAPGAEEEEIPTEFGAPEADDEIDPRWAELKRLKFGASK